MSAKINSPLAAEHHVIMVAETRLIEGSLYKALEVLGAPEWCAFAPTDAEALIEFAGRLCYKSFKPGLNTNVTRVREGNQQYTHNVLKQKHGSVFEHATTSFALLNVSRILTHELVRHRVGIAYSQESQRFVRLDNFQLYIPDLTDALSELFDQLPEARTKHWNTKEDWVQAVQDKYVVMAEHISEDVKEHLASFIQATGIDESGVSFHVKKQLTSALRRLIPGGVTTHILASANHRTWRHLIENRTSWGAEIEIQECFGEVARQLSERYPNIYQDIVNSHNTQYSFEFSKI